MQTKFGDEYVILGTYNGINNPITIKHKKCGYIWNQEAYNFLKYKGCPKCTKERMDNDKRKTQEQFEKEVHEKYGNQYQVLGKYKNNRTPIKMRHNYFIDNKGKKIICNNTFILGNPKSFLRRKDRRSCCPACNKKRHFKIDDTNIKIDNLYLYCLYKHVNKVNKKIYVGITSIPFKDRWSKGTCYKRNPYFYNSICKYGWNNFKHYMLKNNRWIKVSEEDDFTKDYSYSFEEACNLEKKYIKLYKHKYGECNVYNITPGGETVSRAHCKKVLQYDLQGNFIKEFNSIKEASIETKANRTSITNCCKSKSKTAGRYQWMFKDDDKKILPITIDNKNLKLLQYDLRGNYVKTYNSLKEATRITKISECGIYKCCKGIQKVTGGYQWKYENTDIEIKNYLAKDNIKKINKYRRNILQYDLKGNFIQSFKSIREATTCYPNCSIAYSCQNKTYTAGNYIWIYDDIFKEENLKWHLSNIEKYKNNRVFRFDLKGNLILPIFNNVREASQILKINLPALYNCCRGKSITCNNFIFVYEDNWKKEIKSRIKMYHEKSKGKKVYQYSKDYTFIKEHPSIAQASREAKINPATLRGALDKNHRCAGGYRWKTTKD